MKHASRDCNLWKNNIYLDRIGQGRLDDGSENTLVAADGRVNQSGVDGAGGRRSGCKQKMKLAFPNRAELAAESAPNPCYLFCDYESLPRVSKSRVSNTWHAEHVKYWKSHKQS